LGTYFSSRAGARSQRREESHRDGRACLGIVAGMSRLRRTVLALGVTGVVSFVLRLRGTGGVPPQGGGWRELTDAEMR